MEHENDILILDTDVKTEEYDSNIFEETKKDDTFSFNPTVESRGKEFSSYNTKKLNKVYEKYDVVQTYTPKKFQESKKDFEKYVNTHDTYIPRTETFETTELKQKKSYKMKPRAKVWLFSFVAIIVLMGGLAIGNAIKIGNINDNLASLNSGVSQTEVKIDKVIKDIGKLTDEDKVKEEAGELDFSEVTAENQVSISLNEKNTISVYESQTNFFDKICNFFKQLFGG